MRIDRSRFLALTAAIAACGAPAATTPGGAIEIPTTASATPDAPDASRASDDGDAGPPLAFRPATPPSAEAEPPDPPNACTSANATGIPADCTKLRPPPRAPYCESFDQTVDECKELARVLKPAVAERATKCILAKSGSAAICQFGVAGICASQAFRASCGDPSAANDCKAVAKKCAGVQVNNVTGRVTLQECEGALSAVAAKHRPAMLSCMNEGCSAGYCFAYLR
jgi:hypothetical protein